LLLGEVVFVATFEQDLSASASAFVSLVWPKIRPLLAGGELLPMESIKDCEFAKMLDMRAGIDGWQIHPDGMRGIASRIQIAKKAWDTFTIRMSRDSGATTEFHKRQIAIHGNRGWSYPHVTVQAYLREWDGPVLSIGIAKTEDIIDYIERGFSFRRRTTNAEFAVCYWDDAKQDHNMKKHGYTVKIIRSEVKP